MPASADGKLAKAERAILSVLAPYHPASRTKKQLALMAGYASKGGGFNNALGALRSKGYIDGLTATDAGLAALGSWDPLPTGKELLEHWYGQLGKAERLILQALAGAYPKTMTKEEVAGIAGYEASGGGFNNALGRLRTLELISGGGTALMADDVFFE